MLGLLNTVLSRGGSLLTYVKDGLVMASKFTTQGLSFPAQGSAEFNGTSDFIQLEPSPIGAVSAFTISGWINTKQDSTSQFKGVYSKGAGGYEDIVIFGGSTNKLGLYFRTDSGNSGNLYSTTIINDGNWHFFACQWDGSTNTAKLYINGSLETTSSRTGSALTDSFANATIGAYSDIDNFFDGNLANVAIWNRALTSDEINSVMWKSYEGLTGTESNGLQAWYSLDDITSPAASLANMEQLATDKDATIENKAAVTAAINALS